MPPQLTRTELAWEFAELFSDLSAADINELLAKNVPLETLEFFSAYSDSICRSEGIDGEAARRMPNLMLVGYLLRVLEDRLIDEEALD